KPGLLILPHRANAVAIRRTQMRVIRRAVKILPKEVRDAYVGRAWQSMTWMCFEDHTLLVLKITPTYGPRPTSGIDDAEGASFEPLRYQCRVRRQLLSLHAWQALELSSSAVIVREAACCPARGSTCVRRPLVDCTAGDGCSTWTDGLHASARRYCHVETAIGRELVQPGGNCSRILRHEPCALDHILKVLLAKRCACGVVLDRDGEGAAGRHDLCVRQRIVHNSLAGIHAGKISPRHRRYPHRKLLGGCVGNCHISGNRFAGRASRSVGHAKAHGRGCDTTYKRYQASCNGNA